MHNSISYSVSVFHSISYIKSWYIHGITFFFHGEACGAQLAPLRRCSPAQATGLRGQQPTLGME